MGILSPQSDERIVSLSITDDAITIVLRDRRSVSAPLTWFPKLFAANDKQRSHWTICHGGYGVHWPYVDEDLSALGLLRGQPAPNAIEPGPRKPD